MPLAPTELDEAANASREVTGIITFDSRVAAYAIKTDENGITARHVSALLTL